MRNLFFIIIPALLIAQSVHGQYGKKGYGIYSEQDILADVLQGSKIYPPAKNQDRNYTMGFGFSLFGPPAMHNYLLGLPWVHSRVIDSAVRYLHGGFNSHIFPDMQPSFQFAFTGFTPYDLERTTPNDSDRPYASLVTFTSTHAYIGSHARIPNSVITSITFGIMGVPKLPEYIQGGIHNAILAFDPEGRPYPQGWDNQISNGGEPTLMLAYKRKAELYGLYQEGGPALFQFIPSHEFNLGYYTNAAVGGQIRLGRFWTPFWVEDANYLGTGNKATITHYEPEHFSAYLFADVRYRFVVYNALLQGQFRSSAVILSADKLERNIMEMNFGLALEWPRLRILIEPVAGRTPEYKIDGVKRRSHYWGTIGVFWSVKE